MKVALSGKQRVLVEANRDDDWRVVASMLGIKYKTSWQLVSAVEQEDNWTAEPLKCGGARYTKVTPDMRAKLQQAMKVNCHKTLWSIQKCTDSVH